MCGLRPHFGFVPLNPQDGGCYRLLRQGGARECNKINVVQVVVQLDDFGHRPCIVLEYRSAQRLTVFAEQDDGGNHPGRRHRADVARGNPGNVDDFADALEDIGQPLAGVCLSESGSIGMQGGVAGCNRDDSAFDVNKGDLRSRGSDVDTDCVVGHDARSAESVCEIGTQRTSTPISFSAETVWLSSSASVTRTLMSADSAMLTS